MPIKFSEADYKRFRDRMELCEMKVGGGKLGYDLVCLSDLIRTDPAGAESFFEFYLAATQVGTPNYIKLAAIVAVGYLSVHKDDALVSRLDRFAEDPAVRDQVATIELMWGNPPRAH